MKNNSTDKFNTPVKIPYTYTSAYKGLYPVVYCDDVWHIAKENTASGEILGTGQITLEELNNILIGGIALFNKLDFHVNTRFIDPQDIRSDAHFLPLFYIGALTPDLIELGDDLYNSSDIKQTIYTCPPFDSEDTPTSETWNYVGDDALFTGSTVTKPIFAWRKTDTDNYYEGFIYTPETIDVTGKTSLAVTSYLDFDLACNSISSTSKLGKLLKTILSKL